MLSGRLPPADYQSRVMCLTDWRRKGAAYDLAPLGRQHPSSHRPEFKPLPRATLDGAFSLQPGGCRLTEVGAGEHAVAAAAWGAWWVAVGSSWLRG